MPELHKLTPPLGVLQDRGHRVALVTDGRMSGASGKVPAAIHMSPEALADGNGANGPLARVRDGDIIKLCAHTGRIDVRVDDAAFAAREPAAPPKDADGTGRELFALFRQASDAAELGASPILAAAGL
jgi:phosphogluconate dehydratase